MLNLASPIKSIENFSLTPGCVKKFPWKVPAVRYHNKIYSK